MRRMQGMQVVVGGEKCSSCCWLRGYSPRAAWNPNTQARKLAGNWAMALL